MEIFTRCHEIQLLKTAAKKTLGKLLYLPVLLSNF